MTARQLATRLALVGLLIPRAAAPATPEEDPVACAILVATTAESWAVSSLLVEIAGTVGERRRADAAHALARAVDAVAKQPKQSERAFGFEKIASAYLALGLKAEGMALLSRAAQEARGIGREAPSRAAALSCVTSAYAAASQGERALAIAAEISARPGRDGGFQRVHLVQRLGRVAAALHRAGHRKGATTTLNRAAGVIATIERPYWRAHALWALTIACRGCDDPGRAQTTAEEIGETLHALANEGEERLSPVRFKIMALIHVANAFAGRGQPAQARDVLARALALAEGIAHRYLKAEMMKDVALTYAGAGRYTGSHMLPHKDDSDGLDTGRALAIARAIEHPLLRAITLEWIARKRGQLGHKEESLQLVLEALTIARGIQADADDAHIGELDFMERTNWDVLATLARALAEAGDVERALAVARSIPADDYHSRHFERERALRWMAAACLGRGEEARALAMLDEAARLPRISTETIALLARAGRTDRALECLKKVGGPFPKDEALAALAVEVAAAGRGEEALELAARIGRAYTQALALARIGKVFPKPGQPLGDGARRTLAAIAGRARRRSNTD